MHYAWVIVGVTLATQFTANAMAFYAFGVVLAPLADELGVSRASVGMIPFALSWAGALIGPLLGRAVTWIPIQRLMVAGAVSMSVAYFGMSQATELWEFVLGYGIGVSFGLNALAGVVPAALIVNWFDTRRALALGIAGIGISLSGFVMAPVTSAWVESYGWRATFQIFGAVALALVPLVWWLVRSRPADRRMAAYGASVGDSSSESPDAPVARSTRELLREPGLWLISASGGTCFLMSTAMTTHIVTLGTDAGYGIADAAWLLSVMAGMAALAKLLFTSLAERTGERAAFVLGLILHAIGLAALAQLQANYSAMLVASAVFGLGMGSVVPLMNALMARVFGAASFGPALGLALPIIVVFQSGGSPALGYVYDVTGSYELGLWLMAAAIAVPLLGLAMLRLPKSTAPSE